MNTKFCVCLRKCTGNCGCKRRMEKCNNLCTCPEICSNKSDEDVKMSSLGVYVCPYCPEEFTTSSKYQEHLLAHPRSPSFKCGWEGCGKSFMRASSLRVHMRKVHGKASRSPSPNPSWKTNDAESGDKSEPDLSPKRSYFYMIPRYRTSVNLNLKI